MGWGRVGWVWFLDPLSGSAPGGRLSHDPLQVREGLFSCEGGGDFLWEKKYCAGEFLQLCIGGGGGGLIHGPPLLHLPLEEDSL